MTGASRGIGAALALSYAAAGRRLALQGRDAGSLSAVAARCRTAGAEVTEALLDVTDGSAMAGWIARENDESPLDLVIANAGISAGTAGGAESTAQINRLMQTNMTGVVHTVSPALELMLARPPARPSAHPPGRRGQIALMASLASFRGIAGAPAYCASKAAIRVYGEGLRGLHAADGIAVNVICPGFVRTRMTDANNFPMPLIMSPEQAAARIRRGLARNRARIAFPRRLAALTWLLAALPPGWTDPLLARLPGKPLLTDTIRAGARR